MRQRLQRMNNPDISTRYYIALIYEHIPFKDDNYCFSRERTTRGYECVQKISSHGSRARISQGHISMGIRASVLSQQVCRQRKKAVKRHRILSLELTCFNLF